MKAYITRRILLILPTLFILSILVFPLGSLHPRRCGGRNDRQDGIPNNGDTWTVQPWSVGWD